MKIIRIGVAIASKDYFLAGRGLSAGVICGSLVLTNLSAEQIIGLNGNAFSNNMSAMAWEVTAAFAILVAALFFLPKYLRGNFTTLPEFLETKYGRSTRVILSLLLIVGYCLITIPGTLYAGAIALNQIFPLQGQFNLNLTATITIYVVLIGLISGYYAIVGGLKAVAISDTLFGIGLLITSLLVPMFGLHALGNGDIWLGVTKLTLTYPEKLNAIGTSEDPVPFATIFTGMVLANLFYWGTNQAIIQRVLAAQNLQSAQKGLILAGIIKILVPLFMLIPGIIAYNLYHGEIAQPDLAYPQLIADTFPLPLLGILLATFLGGIISTVDSVLNSAYTLFCFDIYQPLIQPNISQRNLIKVGKLFGIFILTISLLIAPTLINAPEGLFTWMRQFTGFFNIPLLVLVLFGLLSRKYSTVAANTVIAFHLIVYTLVTFIFPVNIHYLHIIVKHAFLQNSYPPIVAVIE